MHLSIAPEGHVDYRRQLSGYATQIGGPLRTLSVGEMEVGIWPFTTSFQIDVPPHVAGADLKMTIDGVEITRAGLMTAPSDSTAVPAAPPPGLVDECKAGHGAACRRLSGLYSAGSGLPRDLAKAVELAELACVAADPEGCAYLGNFLEMGQVPDYPRAASAYAKACEGGFAAGCVNLAVLYKDRQLSQDRAKVLELFGRACDLTDAEACVMAGNLHLSGEGTPADAKMAARFMQRACELDPRYGCYDLGALYQTGQGVKQDDARAFDLARKACDAGALPGCQNLATFWMMGKGTKRDAKQALSLLEKVCPAQSDERRDRLAIASACHNLGVLYNEGDGVQRDLPRAAELFTRGCSGGDDMSCHNLGLAYLNGLGVSRDLQKAVELFQKACVGHAPSCTNLGVLYLKGVFVAPDRGKAMDLFKRACEGGSNAACENLKDAARGR